MTQNLIHKNMKESTRLMFQARIAMLFSYKAQRADKDDLAFWIDYRIFNSFQYMKFDKNGAILID